MTMPAARDLLRMTVLCVLYVLAGKLGQLLTVPPAYATVIWPPSGIAAGILCLYGWRLWPGVLVGALLVNALNPQNADIYTLQGGLDIARAAALLAISAGSTLQALATRALVVRAIGWPMSFQHLRQLVQLAVLASLVGCLVSPTMGVMALMATGQMPAGAAVENWVAWWAGDALGVLIFMPLVLVAPGRRAQLLWKGSPLGTLPAIAVAVIVLPLVITFLLWRYTSEATYRQAQAQFEAMALENEKALDHRLDTYENALLGGAGFFRGSQSLSRDQWRHYVDTLQLEKNFPGISGIGWIASVADQDLADHQRRQSLNYTNGFAVHPQTTGLPFYIITYIEPEAGNRPAIGLNIAFEANRRMAAEMARDSGEPAITRKIVLVQDAERRPGFLLLQPLYRVDARLATVAERRAAFLGWVYAPFIADNFLRALTRSQGSLLSLKIYDGEQPTADATIYGGERKSNHQPQFTVRETRTFMQQKWTLVWESTPEFEQSVRSIGPILLFAGGLIFTGLLALLLLLLSARQGRQIEWLSGEGNLALPALLFLLLATTSFFLFRALDSKERSYIHNFVQKEADGIAALIQSRGEDRLLALQRMAQRWEAAGGTPHKLWQADARNYVRQLTGFKALQWMDASYRIRWAEPIAGNESAVGLDARRNQLLARSISRARESGSLTLSPPIDTQQGYSAMMVYQPLTAGGRFDGMLAAVLSVDEFFLDATQQTSSATFALQIGNGGKTYFDNAVPESAQAVRWAAAVELPWRDTAWTLRVIPTHQLIKTQKTLLPPTVLVGGLLVALLSAVALRYIMVSSLRASRLEESTRNLQDTEERHALAVSGMSVGLCDWNIETGELYLSPQFMKLVGITDPQVHLQRRELVERIHPDDRDAVLAMLAGHVAGTRPFDIEARLRHNDGRYVWVHAMGQAKRAASGRAVRMAGSIADINTQKLQQQALKSSAEQTRLLVENAPAAVAMLDTGLRYLMTSRRWIHDYRLEGREIIGKGHYEIFPEILQMPHWLDIHQRALQGENFDKREESWIRDDGRREWIEWAIHPWMDDSGKVGGIIMFTEVITARKEAEESLRDSEERFRTAMAHAPIGEALVAPSGQVLQVNPALCELLDYGEQELLAMRIERITHPQDQERRSEAIARLLALQERSCQFETRLFHRAGHSIWTLHSISLAQRANGEVDYLILQVQDITARKEMERIKNEFVSVVSHELRTPLTSIRASLGLFLGTMAGGLSDKARRLLDIAYDNCERLIPLVNDILDIDKMATGNMRFIMEHVHLSRLLQEAVQANEGFARRLGVGIRLETVDERIHLQADPGRLIQVLSNLISNAAKFSPPGSAVEIHGTFNAGKLRITVADHGPGIPKEFQPRIFQQFSQADSSNARAKGGTGLGLYITRRFVERMNGAIGFETTEGKGTIFWVEFPAVLDEAMTVAGAR